MGDTGQQTWTITDLAQEFGITLRAIRHYEDEGLISPERRGTSRVFHPRDRIRLQLILRGRRLGFSLPEIRTIVNMYDEQPGESGQLHYLLEQIEVRRDELQRLRRDIDETMLELDRVEARCHEDLAALGETAADAWAAGEPGDPASAVQPTHQVGIGE
jgi:DNA-binding transcriptional MerR regulator